MAGERIWVIEELRGNSGWVPTNAYIPGQYGCLTAETACSEYAEFLNEVGAGAYRAVAYQRAEPAESEKR